jgi:hypothetical protein
MLIAFAIIFAAVLYYYPRYFAPSFAGHDRVAKLTSKRDAHDFADCVVEQNEDNPDTAMEYLGRSIKSAPSGDIVLRSRDRGTFINIKSALIGSGGLSIIVRMKRDTEGSVIEGIRKCIED